MRAFTNFIKNDQALYVLHTYMIYLTVLKSYADAGIEQEGEQ